LRRAAIEDPYPPSRRNTAPTSVCFVITATASRRLTVKEQRIAEGDMPLLSARDITELLDIYLPRRERNEGEIY